VEPDRASESGQAEQVSEEWVEESIAVEPGGTLYLDLDGGQVWVRTHAENRVRIRASARGWSASMVDFVVEEVGNDVQFDASIDGWLPFLLGRPRIRVQAWVPEHYAVEVDTAGGAVSVSGVDGRVGVHTKGGHIEVGGVRGSVWLRTASGHIEVEDVVGDLRAHTAAGRIAIAGIDGDAELRTNGGRIKVTGAIGQIDARTAGGRIDVDFAEEPCGRLRTGGGTITVEFSADRGVNLDARTGGGRVIVEPPHVAAEESGGTQLRAAVNGGGQLLELRSGGGNIRLRGRRARRLKEEERDPEESRS
jgi:hypothetical protein